ncbi:protein FAR1-RELATED SEQUENCE 5-like [Silene latifolia]|uniref:protein FAR1-RELATED SEQUENCE 5-like n=1 Tax=Silene latifolia TaxID=37657 RepID=UPI003D76AD73
MTASLAVENTFIFPVVPIPTPQRIDVDEVHAGNRLSLMVTPGGFEEWVRNIATEFTPTIGQTFATIEEGIQFYEIYEIACGFEPSKSSTKRFRSSGDIRTKLIVCHREGFRDSKPTILPITSEEEEPMVKAYQLETLYETQEDFYYAYDIDQNKCLFRVFWADAAARRNYALYGEAVTFDPTYSTNKYDMNFAPFTGIVLGGKEPHCFFTDQCPAMKIAVPATFTTAAHRYCMWHIMKKLPEKDSDLEPADFEERWCSLISEFQLEDNAWLQYLFSKRQRWIPAYYRDIPLGCLLRTMQRSESENSFFKWFENPHGTLVEFWMRFQSAMDQQRAGDSSRESSTRFLEVEDTIFNKTYTVAFNPSTFDATCSCKLFERKGDICKHIIWILSRKGIKKIPDKYLLSRWTKNTKKMPLYDAHGQLLDDFTSSDVTKLQISTAVRILLNINTAQISAENHINELTSLSRHLDKISSLSV